MQPHTTVGSEMARSAHISLTYRFRPETAEALRRAAAERKRAGQAPATQQQIVEEAVSSWLRQHGYLAEDVDHLANGG